MKACLDTKTTVEVKRTTGTASATRRFCRRFCKNHCNSPAKPAVGQNLRVISKTCVPFSKSICPKPACKTRGNSCGDPALILRQELQISRPQNSQHVLLNLRHFGQLLRAKPAQKLTKLASVFWRAKKQDSSNEAHRTCGIWYNSCDGSLHPHCLAVELHLC